MDQQLTVSEARAQLPALLSAVERGEEITVTRHGKPVAVLVRPDRLRVRRAEEAYTAAREVRDLLGRVKGRPLRAGPGLPAGRADELVRQLDEDRSAR